MAYDFKALEKKIGEIKDHLSQELASVRTGRANPAILDSVMIESYGTRVPISQVATISVDDPRSLRVVPWDQNNAKEIEKAITLANLGLSVSAQENGVRVSFPELTSERRTGLLKVAKEKIEQAKASVRVIRETVWNDIQKIQREGKMSEDDKFRAKDEMQKRVDGAGKQFDELLARKEKEITS